MQTQEDGYWYILVYMEDYDGMTIEIIESPPTSELDPLLSNFVFYKFKSYVK